MHLPMSIYPSCDGPRILRVRGYMEMHSTCNLVDVQTMCGIYITKDVQMLIVTYILFMVCYDICCVGLGVTWRCAPHVILLMYR